jgi:glycosyltransferase involved in cell wall biosynthesis
MVVHGPVPPDPRVERAIRVAISEGWQVDVVAMRQAGQEKLETLEGAAVRRLPIAHRWGGNALQVLREYFSFTLLASLAVARMSTRRRYNAVHVHNPPDFLIAAAAWPKLLGARVIFDVHDLAPDMFAMRFGDRRGAAFADRALRVIERVAAAFADFVITVHDPYRRELEARGVPAKKITVVMNSVDESLKPADNIKPRSDFLIVYHGTITPPYGVHLLVEAAATLAEVVPDIRVEIYGAGDRVDEIRSLVRRLGVDDLVYLSGRFLAHQEVLDRVRSAAVGVIPNLPSALNRFALSTKLFEYVSLRIPVVAADLPTIREYFANSEVLFFRAGDGDSLVHALLDVHRNPDRAAARADAAVTRYQEYRWPVQAKRYAELLNRCLDGGA